MPPREIRSGQERSSCLVAVDGSRAGLDALAWGLRYAADHDMDVEVLTVWPAHRSVLVHDVPGHFCAPRWSARVAQRDTVREALDAAVDVVPAVPAVATTLENADAAEAIVRASRRHDLLVLGSRRAHGAHRLTDRVIADAACDVVVVAPSPAPPHDGRGPAARHRAARHTSPRPQGAPS